MHKLVKALFMLLITTFLFEGAGLFIYRNQYNWNHRYQFAAKDSFRILKEGLWSYQPTELIRTAAVYGFPFGTLWVEYECSFQTSRFGLIQAHSQELKAYDLVVLGDSFTEGQGGCPWLTAEATKDLDISVINGGLQGAGISAFADLDRYLSARVEIGNVLVIAISNDFFRSTDSEWIEEGRPCLVQGVCDDGNSWWGSTRISAHRT